MCKKSREFECPSPDISAYLDGELSAGAERKLELHLAECSVCTEDLNLQKSFLNALGSSLESADDIELPRGFTKSVVANAESRVSGLRHPHELRDALLICAALVAFAVLALGSQTELVFLAAAAVAEKFVAVVLSAGHLVYDVALGAVIVFRSLASAVVFNSASATLFVTAVFVLSLYVFSRLLGDFRRTSSGRVNTK